MERPALLKFLESHLYEYRKPTHQAAIAMVKMKWMLEDPDFLNKHCLYPAQLSAVFDAHRWLTLRIEQYHAADVAYGSLPYCDVLYALAEKPLKIAANPLPNKKTRVTWRAAAITTAGHGCTMVWETDHEAGTYPDWKATVVNLGAVNFVE